MSIGQTHKMKERYNSIDILRAIAILIMIQGHIYFLWTKENFGIEGMVIHFFGGWGSPFFLIASGIGFYFFINNRINKEFSKLQIFIETLKRAVFLFVITLIFLIFFGSALEFYFTSIIYWSIFQVIAISMILYFIIPFLKRKIRIITLISIIIIIYLAYFIIDIYKIELLYILTTGGTFTYLPWANFYVFGILIGDILLNTSSDIFKKINLIFILSGIAIFIIWLIWIRTFTRPYYFTPLFFVAYAGFFIVFPIIYYYGDMKESQSFIKNSLIEWGKLSFSIYYIHFAIIAAGFIIFPLIINDIYSNGFLFYQYLILVVLVIVILDIFLRIWKKFNYILGIEWFMHKITKKNLYTEEINS